MKFRNTRPLGAVGAGRPAAVRLSFAAASLPHRSASLHAMLCRMLSATLVSGGALLPETADAETAPVEEATRLETVTVRANPLGKTADDLVQPALVLSGDDLARRKRGTIGETLEREPGVSTTDFGAGVGRPVIRGQSGPRVEMLSNGMSASDVSDVSPDHAVTISPAAAQQVEVLKGPATLLYGSGASAGVVNIIDNRLPTEVQQGLRGDFESNYGTNAAERSATAEVDYGHGHHQLHADIGERKTDDYSIPGCAGVDGSGSCGTLANSNTQASAVAVGYGYIDGGNSITVSVNPYQARYGLPAEETGFITMDATRYDLQGTLNRPLPGLDSVRLRAVYNTYTHAEMEDAVTEGTRFRSRATEQRLEAVHRPLWGWRGVVGLQYRMRQLRTSGEEALLPETHTQNMGVFLVEERAFGPVKLEWGARAQRDRNRPMDLDEARPQRSFTPLSASAGAILNLGRHDHLKLSWTHSERSPVAQELYSYGPHGATQTFERGKANAGIERASNIELGYDHHADRLTLEAGIYYQRALNYTYLQTIDQGLNADGSGTASSDGEADRVDDEGNFDPAGALLLVDYRQAPARFYGVEGQAAYALLRGPVELSASVFGDAVRGRIDNAGNAPQLTPARYGVGLQGARGAVHASVDYLRVTAQNRIAALETTTAGYNDLGMEVSYHFRLAPRVLGDSALYLRGRNLTDDDQRRATSFLKDVAPLPGRTLMLGLRLSL